MSLSTTFWPCFLVRPVIWKMYFCDIGLGVGILGLQPGQKARPRPKQDWHASGASHGVDHCTPLPAERAGSGPTGQGANCYGVHRPSIGWRAEIRLAAVLSPLYACRRRRTLTPNTSSATGMVAA